MSIGRCDYCGNEIVRTYRLSLRKRPVKYCDKKCETLGMRSGAKNQVVCTYCPAIIERSKAKSGTCFKCRMERLRLSAKLAKHHERAKIS